VSEDVAHYGEVGPAEVRLWPRIEAVLEAHGVAQAPGPAIATTDFVADGEPIRVTAAIAVPDDAKVGDSGVQTIELPGIARAASTVIHGDPDYHEAFNALGQWARDAGEKGIGHSREVYLDCDGPRDTWVVELQIALQAR
jgi:effector-binding domain-containing protein